MRPRLPAIGRILFATAFVFVVFLLLEQTHRIALNAMRLAVADWNLDWQRNPLALALDRACYALFLSGAGWLLFRRWLIGSDPPGTAAVPAEHLAPDGSDIPNTASQSKASERSHEKSRWPGLLVGAITGGLLFTAVAGFQHLMVLSGLQPTPHRTALATAIDTGWHVLIYHLIFTAAITAALEEIFFRGCLQGFLIRQGLPPAIAIVFPAVLFGLVHPMAVWPVLFGVGLVFGFLFWRYGLGSAILAHAVYNALLLSARYLFQE